MSKKKESSVAEALEEIESLGDRLSSWASENSALVLGGALGVLLLAGGYGLYATSRNSSLDTASSALATVETEFRAALGVPPDSLEIVEPANPETARKARTEFVERYAAVAAEHAGTPPGALAALGQGSLLEALGEPDRALEVWTAASESLASDEPTRALLLIRIAAVHERAGRWQAAGEGFEAAASVDRYPLRSLALADAARCYATAGLVDRAIDTFGRAEGDAPNARLPDYVRARVAELRARRDAETGGSPPE